MKYFVLLFLPIVCFAAENAADAGRIKRLSGAPKPRLTAEQIKEMEEKESEEHPVEGYVSVKTVVDCFDEMSYQYTGGRYRDKEIKFRLRYPNRIKPGRKYPLVINFHGKGESDDDNKRQLSHLQNTLESLVGPKSLDYFILSTQCPKDNRDWTFSVSTEDGKGDAPITYTWEIMEAVIEEFPIDEDRISAFGFSSGGYGAWKFVSQAPDRFAALVVCSTNISNEKPPPNLKVWCYATTGDKRVPIQHVRDAVAGIKRSGGSVHLTEIASVQHNSWTRALKDDRIHAWMIRQRRHSLFGPPPGVVAVPHTWARTLVYFGLPICCMLPFLVARIRKRK